MNFSQNQGWITEAQLLGGGEEEEETEATATREEMLLD